MADSEWVRRVNVAADLCEPGEVGRQIRRADLFVGDVGPGEEVEAHAAGSPRRHGVVQACERRAQWSDLVGVGDTAGVQAELAVSSAQRARHGRGPLPERWRLAGRRAGDRDHGLGDGPQPRRGRAAHDRVGPDPVGESTADRGRRVGGGAEAVRGAQVVITMLPTSDVVVSVVLGGGVGDAFASGALWAQMGTIGAPETTDLADQLANPASCSSWHSGHPRLSRSLARHSTPSAAEPSGWVTWVRAAG